MRLTATEVRDWLESAATWSGLYLTWRWRPRRKQGRHLVLELHDSVRVSDGLALTTGNDAGTQAVLDSMAELDPDFPQF